MIRYAITLAELEAKVDALAPNWRTEATSRKAAHAAAGKYSEPPAPNWSDVKPVFIELQHGKCAYCERKLGKGPELKVEWDLEHFRPKSSVKLWPSPALKKKYPTLAYAYSTGDAQTTGYYLLAYDLRNYAAGCKACNSSLKRDYFPVASARVMASDDVALLKGEEPLLLFPIGDWGVDPAPHIGFNGTIPIALGADANEQRIGQVTIDFFRLQTREELREERSEIVTKLWLAHVAIKNGATGDDKDLAQQTLDAANSDACRHALCARSFVELISSDEASAQKIAVEADKFLRSKHPV